MHQPATALPEGAPAPGVPPRRGGTRQAALGRWSRLVHVYSSMVLLALVLFFGATGLTLHHPEWTFGIDPTTTTVEGDVPAEALDDDGDVDLLALSQYLRSTEDVGGEISDFALSDTAGSISYRAPGYSADVSVDVADGDYVLTVEERGLVAVLNDLHKGRSTNAFWGWVIDVSATVLVATAIAGLLLQLALRRRRTAALVVAALGGAAAVLVALTTLA